MDGLLNVALKYREMGFSVIATDRFKKSVLKWTVFQERLPTIAEIKEMFSHRNAASLAIICGPVSGNLEVIDIDVKNDLTHHLAQDLAASIREQFPDLLKRLVIFGTPSRGYHFLFRCNLVEPNQRLAMRPSTTEEKRFRPGEKMRVLIETRGLHGYFVTAPSTGYQLLRGNLNNIPRISMEEREGILRCARLFNQVLREQPTVKPTIPVTSDSDSPFACYNKTEDFLTVLQKHGWSIVKQTPSKTILKRPGQTSSTSSADFDHRLGYFTVFSTSTEFEPLQAYRPYAVYAILECGGDYKLAARRLANEGYGLAYQNRKKLSPVHGPQETKCKPR